MDKFKRIHLIAIGGAVMHNLALYLHSQGVNVTGSDDEIYDPAKRRLNAVGILPPSTGWYPENITQEIDAIILGMHAKADNPELLKAQEIGITIYSFPEFIFEQSKEKQRIVIAGSHGKTTITSMILHVLKYHNRSFDYLVGAIIEGFDVMVNLSADAPVIIIEGDEYLNSAIDRRSKFLLYHPHIALISGVEWDHFNVFKTYESYVKAFEDLADSLPKAGTLIYDETDDIENIIVGRQREDVVTVPYKAHKYNVKNGKAYLVTEKEEVELKIFGEHNMKNLMGAYEVLNKIGITKNQFYEAIKSFKGASKRLETIGENDNTLILRDFAHAPSKVRATVNATKSLYPNRKLIACYELHTFSSLNKDFLPQYDTAMEKADTAIVFYSPHTLEMKNMDAISFEQIESAFNFDGLKIMTEREELENYLKAQNWYNSNLLLMSSGTFSGMNFNEFGNEILALPVTIEKTEIKEEVKKKKSWNIFKKKK